MSDSDELYQSFLGTGWSFPPRFAGGGVAMVADEADIHESLVLLFGTAAGERLFEPKYGLDMHELMFEPLSTTLRSVLKDRILTTVLVYEPRIRVLDLVIDDSRIFDGVLAIRLDYLIRSTNSRFNLVFPFYLGEATEALRATRRG